MYRSFAFVYVIYWICAIHAEVKIGIRSPETGIADGSKLSCGCLELNLGPLEEQPGLLAAKPILYFIFLHFLLKQSSHFRFYFVLSIVSLY